MVAEASNESTFTRRAAYVLFAVDSIADLIDTIPHNA